MLNIDGEKNTSNRIIEWGNENRKIQRLLNIIKSEMPGREFESTKTK